MQHARSPLAHHPRHHDRRLHAGRQGTMTAARTAGSIYRHRPFVRYWVARTAASLAFQMQAVAVGWQVYALTGNPLDLGLIGLSLFLPSLLLLFVIGPAADRYNRKTIVSMAQAIEGIAVATLLVGTAGGWLTRELIFATIFLLGVGRAFEAPTVASLLPGIVPPELLSRAVAGASSATQAAFIIGPALGGVLYLVSPSLVYGLCCGLFLTSSILIASLATTAPVSRAPLSMTAVFTAIRFIRREPLILGAITLDLFAVLLGGAMALLPVYARDVFHAGPWGLGLLRTAPAVGALLMSIVLTRWHIQRAGRVMFAGVAMFGITTTVFALSTSFVLSLAMLAILGAADMVSIVVRQTLVQLRTPDEMRGRVSAVNSLFVGTSNQLGDFRAGVSAALFGTVSAVLIGGVGALFVAGICVKLFPDLFKVDRLDEQRNGTR
ncbi:MAG: MFS transporter [Rhizobiales bacterium]|nr:MFS transporter [Hyphomicrobiales bacterium]